MIVKKNNAYRYKKTNSPSKKYIKRKQHHGKKTKRNVMVGGGPLHEWFKNEENQKKFKYLTNQMVSFIVGSLFTYGLAKTIAQVPDKIIEFITILKMMGYGDVIEVFTRIYQILTIILSCMVNLTTGTGTQIISAITSISIPTSLRETVATVSPLIMKELINILNLINNSKIYLFISSICLGGGISRSIVSASSSVEQCFSITQNAFEKIGKASQDIIEKSLATIKSGANKIFLGINYCTTPITSRVKSISAQTAHSAIDTARDCKRNLDIPIDMLSDTISGLIIGLFNNPLFETSEDFASLLIKTLGKGLLTILTSAGAGHPRGMPDVFESETEAKLERDEEAAKEKADKARAELIKELTVKFNKKFPSQKLSRRSSTKEERRNLSNPLSRRSSQGDTPKNKTPFKKLSLVPEMPEGGSLKRRYKRNSQTKKLYRRKH